MIQGVAAKWSFSSLSAIILLFVRLPHKWSHQKRRDAPRNKNLRHISFLCQMQAEAFYAGREHTTRLSSCVLGEEGFLTF